jgi:hypothetical protein
MRRWLVLLFAVLLILPSSAKAQNSILLSALKIHLWAEYDQPSMLVIYDFKVAEDTTLPTDVNIRVPKDGNIIAIAFLDGADFLIAEYEGPREEENWQVVTFKVNKYTTYRLEYYQPLYRDGSTRKFNHQWISDYPIRDFSIEIQTPGDSTGVQTDPTIPFVQDQPFLSGRAMMNGLDAGQVYQLQLQYSREGEIPVLPPASPQVEPAEPIGANTDGRVTLNNLPYILGGVGVMLIVSALYYVWRVRPFQGSAQTSRPRRRQRSAAQETETNQAYCHECGARARENDRFCRACGSKLRGN